MTKEECKITDEVFTHVDNNGKQTHWNASALYAFASRDGREPYLVPVDNDHALYCRDHRGVERERLVELAKHPDWALKPILFVRSIEADGEPSHLLVDGSHRYVLLHGLGSKWIKAFVVDYEEAKAFIIEGLPDSPEDFISRDSLLLEARAVFGFSER